jgi:predicted dehydrogenase
MSNPETSRPGISVTRRDFLRTSAAVGAGLVLAPTILGAEAKTAAEKEINVALIGVGTEGGVLLNNTIKMPGLKFVAVCDIWPYNQGRVVKLLKKYKHDAKGYVDYKEMLDTEKNIDAVVIASPDCFHAEHTIACLKAGKHVYCEKEMSNKLSLAKDMVTASKETKRLLQIGHQRRSNPRYHVALDFITKKKAVGRPTYVEAQWNRRRILQLEWPKDSELDEATLKKYGYDTMTKFRNWRWYKKFSGGPIADLGSHQIDIFNWFLGASPRAVMADAGVDYYDNVEWFDNISAIYEWDVMWGGKKTVVRGMYKVVGTSSNGGYAETFLGDEGSMIISEDEKMGGIRREKESDKVTWEKDLEKSIAKAAATAAAADAAADPTNADLAKVAKAKKAAYEALLKEPEAPKPDAKKAEEKKPADGDELEVKHTGFSPGRYYPPIMAPEGSPATTEHGPHLANFFAAIRTGVPLNCPGEVGYDTAVSVLKVNDAAEAQKRLEFKPEEFKA